MKENVYSFEEIVDDPVGAYEEMRGRLEKYGPNAPFPEFAPAVDYIVDQLELPKYQTVRADHPDLELERKEVSTLLAHTNLAFEFDDESTYPYPRPFPGPYPYRPTIDAIEAGLRLLDKYSRLIPNSKAVPLYHFDRYQYHRHGLMGDPGAVLIPTAEAISLSDFIRTRAVPIGFIGLTGSTVRVDRHYQSPLDFWYHDMNHVRRMVGYLKQSERLHEANTTEEKLALYREMDGFIQEKLMPAIEELPDDAPEADRAVRRLARLMLFEVLHESALAPESDVIKTELLREAMPQPFEIMMTGDDRPETTEETEKLRTPTGNLQSGISTLDRAGNETITIRYCHDRALSLLANIYNKLNFGFYDNPARPLESIAPTEYRTPEYLLKAVHELFAALGYEDVPSDEQLLDLIRSRQGSPEKFVYQGVKSTEAEAQPHATEPLPAEKIIRQIEQLGKRVVTLFGYSDLGYEDPAKMLEQVEAKLRTFDPATTAITIGATEAGIGSAYRVAKQLGFMTLGVVSTLATSYSGHFSPDVDKIFVVNDARWGGYVSGTDKPVDTTEVFLAISDEIHAFGGGNNTVVALQEAHKRGITASFTPADMDHAKAGKRNRTPDYRGPAFHAWQQLGA